MNPDLEALAGALRGSRGFLHKQDLVAITERLRGPLAGEAQPPAAAGIGDDCAVIADGDGHLLFAIEGFVEDFVRDMPWFAGYCGVMVNVSDIHAMGGRPVAVVDALWSGDAAAAGQVLDGMASAAGRYGVPIVGGHSNLRSDRGQLAVAILGRARRLLSSFTARPGDSLVAAVDLRGAYHDPYPYWDASTRAPAARLRADLELLPLLAEHGLCDCAKDISMAGIIGTSLMLLDCSGTGAVIDIAGIPRPQEVRDQASLLRWLLAFPSYGFVLSVRPQHAAAVLARFQERGLSAAVMGRVTRGRTVVLEHERQAVPLWDLAAQPFIMPAAAPQPEPAHG